MKRKLLCLLLSMLLVTTTAQAVEKPNAAVDTSRSCTLTLQYAASGQTVQLYRAADISSNGRYTLCGAFAGYGIYMPAGNGQAEWDALRDTLLAYIAVDALAPDGTAVTGADGRAVFTGLSAGMYLVDKADMEVGGSTRQYAPSLIAVPGVGGGGNWRYDVTAAPKYTEKPGGGDEPDTPVTHVSVPSGISSSLVEISDSRCSISSAIWPCMRFTSATLLRKAVIWPVSSLSKMTKLP